MKDFELTTPIAFIIFNRPVATARMFEVIRRQNAATVGWGQIGVGGGGSYGVRLEEN